jgi:hypothetical protein
MGTPTILSSVLSAPRLSSNFRKKVRVHHAVPVAERSNRVLIGVIVSKSHKAHLLGTTCHTLLRPTLVPILFKIVISTDYIKLIFSLK